jgi:ligand-binding sensor domain-containing protein
LSALTIFAQNKPEIANYLGGANISGIVKDADGLWVSTYGRGIYRYCYKDTSWTTYSVQAGNLQEDFFYCIAVSDDYVWAGSSDGLYTFEKSSGVWKKRKFGLGGELGNWIRSLAYDKWENSLWIGRFKFLTKLELKKNKFSDYDLTVSNNAKTNNIKMIRVDGDSLVWFGTEWGLHKYNKSKSLEDKSSLIYIDNHGDYFNGEGDAISLADMLFDGTNIWFGLDEFVTPQKPNFNIGGIYFYNRKARWDRLDISSGLAGNGVYCLEKTGKYIWASLYQFYMDKKEQYGRGVALINRASRKITKINKDELGIKSDKILCMLFDGDNLWVGSDGGLVKIKLTNELAMWR